MHTSKIKKMIFTISWQIFLILEYGVPFHQGRYIRHLHIHDHYKLRYMTIHIPTQTILSQNSNHRIYAVIFCPILSKYEINQACCTVYVCTNYGTCLSQHASQGNRIKSPRQKSPLKKYPRKNTFECR